MLTVEEARERNVCRICEQPSGVPLSSVPKGWQRDFGEQVWPPPKFKLNFGKEFAHTACLEAEAQRSEPAVRAEEEKSGK